jgi:Flp pilus assembly protein TadG
MKRSRPQASRRGAVVPLAALLIVFITGVLAFSVDCGIITLARTQLQAAADGAALAGADALSSDPTTAITAAQSIAQANYAGGRKVSVVVSSDIELGTWDTKTATFTVLSGSARSSANAVRVTCVLSRARGNGLALFFAPIYGQSTTSVQAQAVARKGSSSCGFIGLNSVTMSGGSYTDSYDTSSGAYFRSSAGQQGNVCSNGDITLSGNPTAINGDASPGPGMSVGTSGGASISGSTSAASQLLVEAAIDSTVASTTNDDSSIPLTSKGRSAYNRANKAFSMSASDSITLAAGTYYFSSMKLSGGAALNFSGPVTVYVTGNVDLSGGTVATSGSIPANFKLYVQGSSTKLSGGANMYAVVYAPTSNVSESGSSDFFGSIIGLTLNDSGSGGLHYDTSLGFSSSNGVAELVQ